MTDAICGLGKFCHTIIHLHQGRRLISYRKLTYLEIKLSIKKVKNCKNPDLEVELRYKDVLTLLVRTV